MSIMAMPAKDPRLLMNIPLRIMLTQDQRELIEKAADATGGDMAAWARPILLRATQVTVPSSTNVNTSGKK
jgi:uncharacterized protein (DUF1778 family)